VSVYSVSHPACNEHAPFCHLLPGKLSNIFPRYLIKAQFLKNVLSSRKVPVILVRF